MSFDKKIRHNGELSIGMISKGQSRIFVFDESHIPIVRDLIRTIDEFEFTYLREDTVALFKGDVNDLTYNGKFDIDIPKLIQACAQMQIGILVRTEPPEVWVKL